MDLSSHVVSSMFKKRFYPPRHQTTWLWKLFGIAIIVASMALGAAVKILWSKRVDSQILDSTPVQQQNPQSQEAERLNRAIGM